MAVRKTKAAPTAEDFGAVARPQVNPVNEDVAAIESPVHALQGQILSAWQVEPSDKRWSMRRTAALLVLTCGIFWGAAGTMAFTLLA